jgi:hypothetical protein
MLPAGGALPERRRANDHAYITGPSGKGITDLFL